MGEDLPPDEGKGYEVTVHITGKTVVNVWADNPEAAISEATLEVESMGANLQREDIEDATAEEDDVKESKF